jgi:hypothetical protein
MHTFTTLLLTLATAVNAGTVCNSNFFLNPSNKCERCSYSRCEIGFYRERCEMGSTQNAQCTPCTGDRPANSVWTTFGMPYLFNNCRWRCDDGYFKENESTCTACSTEACPNNQIRDTCLPFANEDAKCICPAGTFLNTATDTCETCSTEACPSGTTRQTCDGTTKQDAACV